MRIEKLFKLMHEEKAVDLFLRVGASPHVRDRSGKISSFGPEDVVNVEDMNKLLEEVTTAEQRKVFYKNLGIDFALYLRELGRFRVSVFFQRNTPAMVIRNVKQETLSFEELNLPVEILQRLSLENRGLVLLTGTAGSGKSTTIASMMEYTNLHSDKHILTIEEPIEFTFQDKRCIINQREVRLDVNSYSDALRQFTLQSPDVIFISTIRDLETMASAITAAETGILVLSTLHTVNASQTVERIINFFPPHQHAEIRMQLSLVLKGIISLRLVPRKDAQGRIPAYETMALTPSMARLIREGKVWEIPHYLEEGGIFGMQTFTQSLIKLIQTGKISEEEARNFCDNVDEFDLALKGIKRT